MKVKMRKCSCGTYTLKYTCPKCSRKTYTPIPARFSPEDPHGKYRRILRREIGFFNIRRWSDGSKS